MGWSIGFDSNWNRDVGYGVPAWCDHPDCSEVINRGLSYVCGAEPYGGEFGCGLYFCGEHIFCNGPAQCERCVKGEPPFDAKPDHPDWSHHKATDPSWAEWRDAQLARAGSGDNDLALDSPASEQNDPALSPQLEETKNLDE